jgi:oxygen-independent coproporphyrinogen-3 oxidase
MNIYFDADFGKYEIEAVLKIFFPGEKFCFLPLQNDVIGSYIQICITDSIIITACVDNKSVSKSATLGKNQKENELAACRILYETLSEFTGTKSDWGILTGIRPVKKINSYISEGLDIEQIREKFRDDYLISDEKFRLSYLTAVNQSKYLPIKENNTFSLYVGIPFCPSRCSYCSFVSHSIASKSAWRLADEYVEKLLQELSLTAEVVNDLGLKLTTVYIGGGTPTALNPAQISSIMEIIAKKFNISDVFEYTVEAGRADTISEEKLRIIKSQGATRISINPQTLNDKVLKNIGRNHTTEDFYNAYDMAVKLGFQNINTDLIAGLPGDDIGSFIRTIDGIINLSPANITVHTLTLKRAAKLGNFNELYNESEVIHDMSEYSFRKITENGYTPYYLYRQKNNIGNGENVGYAMSGFECLYNIYIMEENQTIIACGAGGSTKIYEPKPNKLTRIFNYKYPYEYVSKFDEVLKRKHKIYDYFGKWEAFMTLDFDRIVTKTVKGAKYVADTATKTATVAFDYTKNQIDRAAIRDKIKETYQELGKLYYSEVTGGADTKSEMRDAKEKLDTLFAALKETEKAVKPLSCKVCDFCNAQNSKDSSFCSKCGEKL